MRGFEEYYSELDLAIERRGSAVLRKALTLYPGASPNRVHILNGDLNDRIRDKLNPGARLYQSFRNPISSVITIEFGVGSQGPAPIEATYLSVVPPNESLSRAYEIWPLDLVSTSLDRGTVQSIAEAINKLALPSK